MRVEFVGLPAAGKTAACRQAHATLLRRGITARLDCVDEWRHERRGLGGGAGASAASRRASGLLAAASAAWLLRAAASPAKRAARGWRPCAYLLVVDARARDPEEAPVWLQDQASVQGLWSVAMRSGAAAADVERALGPRIAWPDLLVEVRAPVPTVVERLRRRPSLPASLGPTGGGLREALPRAEAALAALRQRAAARGVEWLAVDDGADAGARVAFRVEAALRRPDPRPR